MNRAPVVLAILLVVIWLMLNATLSLGHVLLGVALAIGLLMLASSVRPLRPRLRRPHLLLPLLAVVVVDVIRSNIGVARVILGWTGGRQVHSGFLDVPLELRDPHALALLSAIITATPGTAWAGVSTDGSTLTLHVLDLRNDADWIRTIKDHYERPLLRIFG